MTITETGQKIKRGLESWFGVVVLLLVAVGSFGLGRLSKIATIREPIKIEMPAETANAVAAPASGQNNLAKVSSPASSQYVASKNGTKYYLTTCSGANRIKPENKVYFPSVAAARAAGLTPAANCPGL